MVARMQRRRMAHSLVAVMSLCGIPGAAAFADPGSPAAPVLRVGLAPISSAAAASDSRPPARPLPAFRRGRAKTAATLGVVTSHTKLGRLDAARPKLAANRGPRVGFGSGRGATGAGVIAALLARFPEAGPGLAAAIAAAVEADPALAVAASTVARGADPAQQQAIGAGLAEAAAFFGNNGAPGALAARQLIAAAIAAAPPATVAGYDAAGGTVLVMLATGGGTNLTTNSCVSPSRPGNGC